MNNRLVGGILLVLGVALIVVGALMMFVIVPGMKQFPDDVDTTRNYTGTMPVLLNAADLTFMSDLPVDLVRHFETLETDGDLALVREEQRLLHAETGDELQSFVKHYAINRESMESVTSGFPEAWAENENFWDREGLVLGWPIDTEEQDYTGWSDDYRDTVTLEFVEEVDHEASGMTAYHYRASHPVSPIAPEHVEAINLPLELPNDVFVGLVQSSDSVDPAMANAIPLAMAMWDEETVPLAYYYAYEADYWIEPQTGVLLETSKHELRKVGLGDAFMEALPASLSDMTEEERDARRIPVFDLTYETPQETIDEAAQDAQDVIDQINLYGTTIPIILIVIGVVLGLLGLFLALRQTPPAEA